MHWLHLLWFVDLWTVKAFLDLDDFPHISQKWTTPAIWCASMCFLIASFIPSFPHTLHSQFLPCKIFLLLHIIDLICSSRFSRSALTLSQLTSGFVIFEVMCFISSSSWYGLVFYIQPQVLGIRYFLKSCASYHHHLDMVLSFTFNHKY